MIFGIVFTATRVNLVQLRNELQFRGDSHVALERVLHDPAVTPGVAVRTRLRAQPQAHPRRALDPRPPEVGRARALQRALEDATPRRRPTRGVVILVHDRPALFKQAFVTHADETADNLPPAGYDRAATSQYYAAYVNC